MWHIRATACMGTIARPNGLQLHAKDPPSCLHDSNPAGDNPDDSATLGEGANPKGNPRRFVIRVIPVLMWPLSNGDVTEVEFGSRVHHSKWKSTEDCAQTLPTSTRVSSARLYTRAFGRLESQSRGKRAAVWELLTKQRWSHQVSPAS
jgi:hypothetical protein